MKKSLYVLLSIFLFSGFSNLFADLTLTSPNGGENYKVGSVHNITWSASGVANVKLEYTTDGVNWFVIANNEPSLMPYAWTIPDDVSNSVIVRISDVVNPATFDVSDAPFTIFKPSVTITAPNGGEVWHVGNSENITWTSNDIANVKIEFSIDNGLNWSTVIASTDATTGTYAWTIPNNVSTTVKVRISDVLEAAINDESNAIFTINNPSVTITAPNGGEIWHVGNSENITWTSNDIANVKIEFSIDNGLNWSTVIASTDATTGTYAWTIPNNVSTTVKVRISDVLESAIKDESNATFTINNPSVTVTAPNGGENWRVGTNQNITWTSNEIANVKIEFSIDNGLNWSTVIASTDATTGTYAWSIPNNVSTTVKVRISDVLEAAINDESNATFTINNPSVTVTAPNGGEIWHVGNSENITWTSNDIANVKIEFSIDNGLNWSTVIASTDATTGTYAWTVPNNVSTTVKVRISDVLEAAINDESNATFTINNPSVTVTAPNGGENWRVGTNQNITWTSNDITNVKIEYTIDNGINWSTVVASTNAALGTYTWAVANDVSSTVTVRVSDVSEAAINDVSDGSFTIYQPSVTVVSPNGGENLRIGKQHNITWTSNNITDVKIEYTIDNGVNWTEIVASVPASDASYNWTIPNSASVNCKIRISDVLEPGMNDLSNSTFTIYAVSLALTSPNGAENWRVGTNHNITWTSSNLINVQLDYSSNNGVDWLPIIASTSAVAGSYNWTIPNTVSDNCIVKVTDTDVTTLNDVSDATFKIYQPTVTVTSPNGGESWKVGNSYNITWTSNNITNVKIDYSTDNGSNWINIQPSVPANTGSYSWAVPNTVSLNSLVKISDAIETTINDESDNVFTIFKPAISLTTPNGTENWRVGNSYNIVWSSNDIANIKIEYTTNNGSDWIEIINSVPASNLSYNWTIPNTVSINCKVRVSDITEPSLNDVSNSVFSIYNPGLTLMSPNGGEKWRVGKVQNITWTSNNINNLDIQYSTDGGTNWNSVVTNTPANTGTYAWTIPDNVTLTGMVKITDSAEPAINDQSDAVFTIYKPAINLTSPIGGETWRIGTQKNITWESNDINNVKIEYTIDNGGNWFTVVASVPASDSLYVWTIPNLVSDQCKIKISDVTEPTLLDISDATFVIYQPSISVTSPNGGEYWRVGLQKNITWTSNYIQNVKIEYTTDNGTNWETIINSTPGSDHLYSWTVPATISTNAKVRISDVLEPALSDLSNATFTIYQPTLAVTTPNGGEIWREGTIQNITWSVTNIANIKIEYTKNNGIDWVLISGSTDATTGTYAWLVPNDVTANAKVRISDILEPSMNDISDAPFTIYKPGITVNSPNGGENWRIGTQKSITWVSNNIANVKIEYSSNNGADWFSVVPSINAGLGIYDWTVPNTVSVNCLIKISDVLEPSVNDVSNSVFNIYDPSLSLTRPDGGETFRVGTAENITWVNNLVSDVKIEYSSNNGNDWITIVASTPAIAGTYAWLVPNTLSVNCKVRISDVLEPGINDVSTNVFEIYNPSITVKSPNGGELWRVGTQHNIVWANYRTGNLKIEFSPNAGATWQEIATNIPSTDTSYQWTIPATVGTNCIIKISDVTELTINDISNAIFTVYQPNITINSPNGGERWRVGTQQSILWTSGYTNNINLEYSTDNGATWLSIINGVNPAAGNYPWIIPNTPAENCILRITDALEPAISDVSDLVFAIYQPSITVSTPNGGELWRVGSVESISWVSNDITDVKIEYTTNNGINWLSIADTASSASNYLWTIPNTVSANCKVRISDLNESSMNDISNEVFSIYQPNLTVTSPNGGELWRVASTQNITWLSNNINNVKIEYSTDNGTTWADIVSSTAATTGSYSWLVPNNVSTNCRVKISDVLEPEMFDISNAKFTIYLPSILITAPNGGEEWRVGTTQQITWASNNIANVKIEYSTDAGANWSIITAVTSGYNQSYSWVIPNTVSKLCKIKVSDISYLSMNDESNTTFEIYQPGITVTAPNGGEIWRAGTEQNITWQSNNIAEVKIEYSTNNGVDWIIVKSSTDGTSGLYKWTVPGTVSSICKVKISDVNEITINDVTDGVFSIYQPTLALTSPNGDEYWRVGTTKPITWTSVNIANVKLEYTTNNGTSWIEITASTPDSTNSYSWVIPNTTSNNCKVRVSDVLEPTTKDESNATFIIYDPAISLVKPNGGEKWRTGTLQNITWESKNINNIKIEYSTDNDTTWNIIVASVSAATKTYTWTIPDTPSKNCKVRISDINEPTMKDVSNNTFTIYTPHIAVTSPIQGDYWRVATTQQVTWTSNDVDNLKIEYSVDNGSNWMLVAPSVLASTGKYNWVIPYTPSINCKLRLSDASEPTVNKMSDSTFTIYLPRVAVLTPNGDEYWRVGTQQNITWSSNDIVNVKIEYSTNNGTEWDIVSASVPGSTGKYVWTIPNTESENCIVRISDVLEPEMYDISNKIFKIYQSTITVTSPNGGEKWRAGELMPITWTSNNVNEVRIEYTTNDTTNWVQIISGIPAGAGKYTWAVPNAPSLVSRIRVSDILTAKVNDISDNVFTIFQSTLNLTSPNGGENWRAGSKKNITWTSTNIDKVNLEFTSNNGGSWNTIATEITASVGIYEWTLPSDLSSVSSRVRISNSESSSVYDVSNSVFTISRATIYLTSPNGGENWRIGKNYYISWQGSNLQAIKIEYSIDGGATWSLVANNVPAVSGSYIWNVANSPSENSKIKITDVEDANINSISKAIFTISLTGIKLLAPNGKEYWRAGTSRFITWQSTDVASVKLEYTTDGGIGWNLIAENVSANDKYYNWVIPGSSPSTNCKVRVSDMSALVFNDASDSVFTIYQPSVTLLTPNGGEEYQIGVDNPITWISNDITALKIEITTNSGNTWNAIVGSVVADSNYYLWKTGGNPSSQCKIRISASDESTVNDISATRFTTFRYPSTINLNTTIKFEDVTYQTNYKLIGIPGNVNLPMAETVTGNYKDDWRAFYDNGNPENYYSEYDGSTNFNFIPGKAFWLVSRNGFVVSKEFPTVPLDANNFATIPLHSGWNIISSPFEKSASWSRVIAANNLTLSPLLYGWDGEWNYPITVMNPYTGYYFYNSHALTELKIPYSPSGAINSQLHKTSEGLGLSGLFISLMKETESVSTVYVDLSDSASIDFDSQDYYSPPDNFIQEGLKIFNDNISSGYKYLFADTRPIAEGESYDIMLTNKAGSKLELKWNEIPEKFGNYEAYIVDGRINKFYNLRSETSINIPVYYKENSFKLLIGSENFINLIKQSLLPTDYILYQNYPNPFNAGTVIRYSLPFDSNVNISLYNSLGELVTMLVNEKQDAGYFEKRFEVSNLASGVYFYRINAKSIDGTHDFNSTKKMVLLK